MTTKRVPSGAILTTASAESSTRVCPRTTYLISRVCRSRWRSTIAPVRIMFSRSKMVRLSSSSSSAACAVWINLPPHQLLHESFLFELLQKAVADKIFRVNLAELRLACNRRINHRLNGAQGWDRIGGVRQSGAERAKETYRSDFVQSHVHRNISLKKSRAATRIPTRINLPQRREEMILTISVLGAFAPLREKYPNHSQREQLLRILVKNLLLHLI